MATLLLTFANSDSKRLTTLKDEFDGVSDALRERTAKKDFAMIADPTLNRAKMAKDIRANESDICLFLFSGHAGRDQLLLEDGVGHAEGIAGLLGRCPTLKLVILNGCSTAGQVDNLLENGIPIVIATSSPIGDEKATQFSIAFFTELANGQSIREAFNRSLDRAKVYGKIQEVEVISRGVGMISQRAKEKPLWGIYYNQQDEALLDTWRLPVKDVVVGSDEINQDIKKALVAIAKKYSIQQTPNAALERLPFIINEPIRNLFAIKAETQESNRFYDTASWERFQMILYAYRAIINLTTYTLLAELWDKELRDQLPLNLSGKCLDLIETALFNERTNDVSQSHLTLLQTLGQVWIDAKVQSFLAEITELMSDFSKEKPKKALADLESKITDQERIKRNLLSPSDILRLCLEAEKSFSYMLFTFGFWVKYSLTSVKDIELFKFRQLETSYLHRIVLLQIGYIIPKTNDDQYSASQPMDSSSIILHKLDEKGNWSQKEDKEGSLNLSPFLIDKNALIKAPKADLHYLLSFSPKQNFFCYRKASSFQEVWPIRPEKKPANEDDDYFDLDADEESKEFSDYHTLLKDQSASFCLAVLNKSLDEL